MSNIPDKDHRLQTHGLNLCRHEPEADRQGLDPGNGPVEGMFGEENDAFWDIYDAGGFAGDPTAYGNS